MENTIRSQFRIGKWLNWLKWVRGVCANHPNLFLRAKDARRRSLGGKEGPPTTHQETKYGHFSLFSTWLRLCINITYIHLNLSNRNCQPLMSSLFIKSTFSLEINYSIITTYQIWLTGVSISTNGNFALCGQRLFLFLMCCWQSLLSFRTPGNLNPRKGGTALNFAIPFSPSDILLWDKIGDVWGI
jgi:hypothetical protein